MRFLHLLFFLYFGIFHPLNAQSIQDEHGAFIRSDTLKNSIYLCFTGHDFYDGFEYVLNILNKHQIKASFFLTGDFIRNHKTLVKKISENAHYIGAHSDKHLLYCDWTKRNNLLVTKAVIQQDIVNNLIELNKLNIHPKYFMPPYEWYNKTVVQIAQNLGQLTVNFSPGTRSNADYTTPEMLNYISSKKILKSIFKYEKETGMNGFHLLIHPGVHPSRKDKLYLKLNKIIKRLKQKGYGFARF